MEHLLRELLMGLLRKFWPYKRDPLYPLEEILAEKPRFMRLYRIQLLLFFVNWALIAWVLGQVFRVLYFATLRLPAGTIEYVPLSNWQFYVVSFIFGLALAGPLSNVWIRSMTDEDGWLRFKQFSEWKNNMDSRAALPLVWFLLLLAIAGWWGMICTPLILTQEKLVVRDKWWPVHHEYAFSEIESIDHYDGYINRAGELRKRDYFEMVGHDGVRREFADADALMPDDLLARRLKIIDILKEKTGLPIREMGYATPFADE
ncbi:MAG TPA: hypothetical protein PKL15_04575 [Saprospiraceae bacterium]|nr:hypothetical protein [Saprospiraceae bacterium]HNM24678.1 hypothetical protein [Saprospiraceae bacterium]